MGADEFGQLGDGTDKPSSVPRPVCAIGEAKAPCKGELGEVRSISGAAYDGYALLKSGTVAAWGYNGEGALGNGGNRAARRRARWKRANTPAAWAPASCRG